MRLFTKTQFVAKSMASGKKKFATAPPKEPVVTLFVMTQLSSTVRPSFRRAAPALTENAFASRSPLMRLVVPLARKKIA